MVANDDSQISSFASTTLDAWATTPSKWRHAPEIEFRVRRRGEPTRRLRLPGARYTLGSGTGCSIPLEDASLRPLHAVLIRDEERILVRAYSVPFQINNQRMSEGLLSVGDRLRLGTYEFELLESSSDAAREISHTSTHSILSDSESDATTDDVSRDEQSRLFHEEAKQWRALKQDAQRREAWCRTREHELQEQHKALQQQLETLHKREADLQTQESAASDVHDELQSHYQELLQHRDALELQQTELNTGREHLRLQQEQLEGRDRLHRHQIDKLIGEQEQFKRIETESQQKLAHSEEQLRNSRQQAESATSAVTQMREKFALLSEQLNQLTAHQASLSQLEAHRSHEHRQLLEEAELDRDELLAQCEYANAQRENVTMQRDDLTIQRDELISERNDIALERDEIAACCHELESIQSQLRMEIEQLQRDIARTRADADTLNQDCHDARETISELQDTIRDQDDRYEADRQMWTSEVDALRKNIDELSLDLDNAHAQLTQLCEDNTRLADQLIGATAERDEARAERETAVEQCQVAQLECQSAQHACDTAIQECESARLDLENARMDVKQARQERDEAAAFRDHVLAQRDEIAINHHNISHKLHEISSEQAAWAEQKSQADRRYQEARTHLADAREKCERAVRARDEAEAARLSAAEKLATATADLKTMQAERDEALAGQEELRRQRDSAIQNAKDARELFDRSNRDHDDTLDLIERLERKTREVMGGAAPQALSETSPRISLLDVETSGSFDAEEVWPTYSSKKHGAVADRKHEVSLTLHEPHVSDSRESATTPETTLVHPVSVQVDVDVDEPLNVTVSNSSATVSVHAVLTDSEDAKASVEPAPEQGQKQQQHSVAAPALAIVMETEHVSESRSAEDDSIEAYMNRLLRRVQGRITDAAPDAAAMQQEDEVEPTERSVVTADAPKLAVVPTTPEPAAAPAPEKDPTTVSSMRRTSLQPATSPVRNHVVRIQHPIVETNRSRAMMKFAQMGIALMCGIAAIVLVNLPMLKLVAAIAALLIAAICAKEAMALKSEVLNRSNPRTEPSQPESAATSAAA